MAAVNMLLSCKALKLNNKSIKKKWKRKVKIKYKKNGPTTGTWNISIYTHQQKRQRKSNSK